MNRYRISELARRTGLTASTIRYYEKVGLLHEAERTPAGYRLYEEEAERRLVFIVRAKRLALSLEEIAELLEFQSEGRHRETRDHLQRLMVSKLKELHRELDELAIFGTQLEEAHERLASHPTLNRDGDCLSDLVMQMFGSIAGAESLLISLDEDENPETVMSEAPHGTAPSLAGKDVANPMAMILAGAALLTFFGEEEASRVSRAIYEATFETVLDGIKTADLGGGASTREFTDEIIRHVKNKLEVWSALA